MSATLATPTTHRKAVDEQRDIGVSFEPKLPSGVLLTVSPTFVQTLDDAEGATTSDLTITNGQINTVAVNVNNKNVIIGQAVLFHVTGGVAGTTYNIRVKSGTVAEPVLIVDCRLGVDA